MPRMNRNTENLVATILAFLVTEACVFTITFFSVTYSLWRIGLYRYRRGRIQDFDEATSEYLHLYLSAPEFWIVLILITSGISIYLMRKMHWNLYGASGKLAEIKFLSQSRSRREE